MSATVTRPDHDVLPERPSPERVSAVVVALALFGFFAWVVLTLPIQPALILVVAGTLAFVGWLAFSYDHPVRSRKVVATYLCAVSFQLVHMAEEYTGGFPHEIVRLFHSSRPWSERSFLLTFVFGFGALWPLAGAGALYQVRIANFMLWFYAVGAGLLNAVAPFVFPVLRAATSPASTPLSGTWSSAPCCWACWSRSRAASGLGRPGLGGVF